jgi:hypothetical protein
MKITKLMLSALAAVLVLVSCNKENTTPDVSGNLKSVQISLKNVAFETKGAGLDYTGYDEKKGYGEYNPFSANKSDTQGEKSQNTDTSSQKINT